jgi:site-specific DNA-methyltransferase (adenine-specific)/adenine-specific DNA-methyltransferase
MDWDKYLHFVSSIFSFELKSSKVSGYQFEGVKNGDLVKVFNYKKFNKSSIDESFIKEINSIIFRHVSGRIYIVAPANNVDFISDYYEIGDVRYYFLKIPYQVIKELNEKPFQRFRQPKSSSQVNMLDEAVGFHFIRKPDVKSELITNEGKYILYIKSFNSKEPDHSKGKDEKSKLGFDLLSAIFIDGNYDDEAFVMDYYLFMEDLKVTDKGVFIDISKYIKGNTIMIKYTDIFGNDFSERIVISEVSNAG